MSDAYKIAGSPIEYAFGETTIKFSPITFGLLADFEAWCLSKKINTTLSFMPDIEPAEKSFLIRQMTAEGTDWMAALNTPAGIIHILSMCATDDAITDEVLGALIKVGSMEELGTLVEMLMGTDSKNAKKPGAKK